MDRETYNLVDWKLSGQPRSWVRQRRGAWSREDLESLLETLKQSKFWPLHIEDVERILKETTQNWWKRLEDAAHEYPFLLALQLDEASIPGEPIEVMSMPIERLRTKSLLEDMSEAAGHGWRRQAMYIVRDGRLQTIDVRRVARCIYPPEYLHPGKNYPPDEWGTSETVGEALARQDLQDVQYVVVHNYGFNSSEQTSFNCIAVATVAES